MIEYSIAEEHFAKIIAFWHGQKLVLRHPTKGSMTYAATRGYDSGFSWEVDRFVQGHWQEYLSAAKAVLDQR